MDFPFDIYDVADQLGLELKKQHPKSSDYNCPFCDGGAKLNLNVEHNVFRCNRCGEYGGMIDLFCKLTGHRHRQTEAESDAGLPERDQSPRTDPQRPVLTIIELQKGGECSNV